MNATYWSSARMEFRRATWRDRHPQTRRQRIWQRVIDWLTDPISFPGKIVDGTGPTQKEYNEEGSEASSRTQEPVPQLDEPRASQS